MVDYIYVLMMGHLRILSPVGKLLYSYSFGGIQHTAKSTRIDIIIIWLKLSSIVPNCDNLHQEFIIITIYSLVFCYSAIDGKEQTYVTCVIIKHWLVCVSVRFCFWLNFSVYLLEHIIWGMIKLIYSAIGHYTIHFDGVYYTMSMPWLHLILHVTGDISLINLVHSLYWYYTCILLFRGFILIINIYIIFMQFVYMYNWS